MLTNPERKRGDSSITRDCYCLPEELAESPAFIIMFCNSPAIPSLALRVSKQKQKEDAHVRSNRLALIWRTYGSWLPGDERGWVKHKILGIKESNEPLNDYAQSLTKEPVTLSEAQRAIVEQTIRDHCRIRTWTLHAVNVRSNHVHVVVSAAIHPDQVMQQFKAWCSRRLNEATENPPEKWWAIHGSTKWINQPSYLEDAIVYVVEGQ